MDRAHRIGQQKQVYVFRFVTEVCFYPLYLTGDEGSPRRADRTLLRRRSWSARPRSFVSTSSSSSRVVLSRPPSVRFPPSLFGFNCR